MGINLPVERVYGKIEELNIVLPGRSVNYPWRDDKTMKGDLAMSNTLPQNMPQDNPAYSKRCSRCEKWLPFSAFSRARKTKDGLNCYCRKCKVIIQREARPPDVYRRYRLRSLFGITIQQYDRMLVEQDAVCAVCKRPETHPNTHSMTGDTRLLSVDHDHETGDVRKLLCSSCNVALGRMGEDPERIRALADYAEWCRTREPNKKIIQLPLLGEDIDKNKDCS